MPADEAPTDLKKLTKEETAHLIRTLWSALQAPGWTIKNRRDLEKLGEALLSGKSLKELDDALYDRIFPHLVAVATHLGHALRTTSSERTQPDPIPHESARHDPLAATTTHAATTTLAAPTIAPATTTIPAENTFIAKA